MYGSFMFTNNHNLFKEGLVMMNTEGFSAADLAAVIGNNNDGFGGNGNGAWWLLILLLFANNGWGNNAWGNNGGGVAPYMMGYAT